MYLRINEGEPEAISRYEGLWEGGVWFGALPGVALGTIAAVKTQERFVGRNIISVPTTKPAIENYESPAQKSVEAAAFAGPIILLAAVGAAAGKVIENRLKRKEREQSPS